MVSTRIKLLLTVVFAFVFLLSGNSVRTASGNSDFSGYRGINVTLRRHPVAADMDKITGWGVNLVRLVINGEGFLQADGKVFNETEFRELDNFLDMAAARKIAVIIDTHTFPGQRNGAIWEDYRYWSQLENLWTFIAQRYRNNSTVIAYEPMNEPTVATKNVSIFERRQMGRGAWSFPNEWKGTPKDYFALTERVGQAINKVDPTKAVIVSGVGIFGHPVNFRWMRPVNVQNVVYTFHMYIPHKFTDSGKGANPTDVSYDSRGRAEVLNAMEPVREFARRYNARIFVGEFGLTYNSEGRGAAEWLREVLDYFEQSGWSWAYWTYSIDLRNPAMLFRPDGPLEQREDTERLTVLKSYFARNKGR